MAHSSAKVLVWMCILLSYGLMAEEKPATLVKQEFIINASIEKAWMLLGPGYADIQTWASAVRSSSASDNQSFNGSPCTARKCSVSGIGHVKESLTHYSPTDHTLSYQVIEGNPKPVKYVASTWKLTDLGNGKTKLEIIVELKTGGFIGSVFKGALKKKISKLYSETGEELKYYVENEQPHPRKVKAISKA